METTCINCESSNLVKCGKTAAGTPRLKCKDCGNVFSTPKVAGPLGDMRLPLKKAAAICQLMTEGMSVRSIERITGVHRDTVLRLLVLVGEKCEKIMAEKIKNVSSQFVQCDEVWSFVECKQRKSRSKVTGDQYAFTALDMESKLLLGYAIGKRDGDTAHELMKQLAERIEGAPEISTDAFSAFAGAIEDAFLGEVHYTSINKQFHAQFDPGRARYSPARLISQAKQIVFGKPDKDLASTSHVERSNLTIRMHMRRFTRLTNAFSKKLENLKAAFALHAVWYNFCRVHRTLRCTPAQEAGIESSIWEMEDVLKAA